MRHHQQPSGFEAVFEKVEACDDPREGLVVVEEAITSLSADGRQVPEDLVRLRKALQTDLAAQSQGR